MQLQFNGQAFNKSRRIEDLMARLDGRSHSAVEYTLRNISAVMNDLEWPLVSGYKALANYQQLRVEVVVEQIQKDPRIEHAAQSVVEHPAAPLAIENPESVWVPAPKHVYRVQESPASYNPGFSPEQRD